MTANPTTRLRQANLFDTNAPPLRWEDLPLPAQKELLRQLGEMLQSPAARKLIQDRKVASRE
jgi:hypothetical protein